MYSTKENLNMIKSAECLNNSANNSGTTGVYNSNCSVYSSNNLNGGDGKETVLFLGFQESWERDLWSIWLLEVQ
jgi:PH domain/leucine-rich repeat-containing protein phosphatase